MRPSISAPVGRSVYLLPALAVVALGLAVAVRCGPDLIRLRDLVVPVLVSVAVVIGSLGVGHLLTSDRAKVAVIAVLFVLAFATLGDASEALRHAKLLWLVGGDAGVVALYALTLGGATLAIRRSVRPAEPLCRYAATVCGIVGAMNAAQLVGVGRSAAPPPIPPGIEGTAAGKRPDIYLIIVDKYVASWKLRTTYGLDNEPLASWLEARGFVLPESARTNYVHSFLSLASMLNFRHLDDYAERFGRTNSAWHAAYGDIENSRLASFLKAEGYRFVFLPSAFRATRFNRYADLQIPDPADVGPEFEGVWRRSTALPVLRRLGCAVLGCDTMRRPYVPETADLMDWKFDALGAIPPAEQPTFVFAHLLVPHDPFIYRADCTHREPYWPASNREAPWEEVRSAYVGQVRCVNRKLRTLVEAILTRSAEPPIILIQADHGVGPLGFTMPAYQLVTRQHVEDRLAVFAAYHLPGVSPDSVYAGMTPVNVVRLVLRSYFGADLPPLKDASYWSSTGRPYDFLLVSPSGTRIKPLHVSRDTLRAAHDPRTAH